MKVLFYIPTVGKFLTGAPRRLLSLMEALNKNGVTVVFVGEPSTDLYEIARSKGFEVYSLVPNKVLSARRSALLHGRFWHRIKVGAFLIKHNFDFFRLIKKAKPDVVWMRGSKAIGFAGIGLGLSRHPLVWDVDYELPSVGLLRYLHHYGLFLSTRVIMQHHGAHDIFGQRMSLRYSKKIQCITPGIELEKIKASVDRADTQLCDEEELRIIQVGMICPRKNQHFTLNILKKVAIDSHKAISISFVGEIADPKYSEVMSKLIAELPSNVKVKVLGWRDDVNQLISGVHLLIMPSKDEGVPNTVQEAMALGVPALVSDRGGMPEIIKNNETGFVLPLEEAGLWVEKLSWLIRDPSSLIPISQACTDDANKRFGVEAWALKYFNALTEANFR